MTEDQMTQHEFHLDQARMETSQILEESGNVDMESASDQFMQHADSKKEVRLLEEGEDDEDEEGEATDIDNTVQITTFPRFGDLPPELRLLVLLDFLAKETVPPIRTLRVANRNELQIVTRARSPTDSDHRPLWRTGNSFIRGEIERNTTMLPVRWLRDRGTIYYHINTGLTSRLSDSHEYIGHRRVQNGAVFYLDPAAAWQLFGCLENGVIAPESLAWLTNILVECQTLVTLFRKERQPVLRLLLPWLRGIYIGFARRWGDVVLVDSPCAAEVLIHVRVVEEAIRDWQGKPTTGWRVEWPEGVDLHAGLMALIMNGVRALAPDVRGLEREYGLDVSWVAVRDEGTVRPRDVIHGMGVRRAGLL